MNRDFTALHSACPKCAEPFLHVKDWGRAGALFVHGYDTDLPSGLRFPIACHVPEQVALGLMTIDEWRGPETGGENENYSRSAFGMDCLPGPYQGWTDGGDWNGWATPLFEFEEALRLAKDYAALEIIEGEVHQARYNEENDAFIFLDPATGEEEVYGSEVIDAEGREIRVYSVGTNFWTWEEEAEDD